MIRWQWCRLHDLSATQLYGLFAARVAVFVVEQDCAYQDLDGHDLDAGHLIGWSGTTVAACLRLLQPGVTFAELSIGRVVTTASFRGTGIGREMMSRAVAHIDQTYPRLKTRIGAQAHLQKFYGAFGFTTDSGVYLEDGIPHVEMIRVPACEAKRTTTSVSGLRSVPCVES